MSIQPGITAVESRFKGIPKDMSPILKLWLTHILLQFDRHGRHETIIARKKHFLFLFFYCYCILTNILQWSQIEADRFLHREVGSRTLQNGSVPNQKNKNSTTLVKKE